MKASRCSLQLFIICHMVFTMLNSAISKDLFEKQETTINIEAQNTGSYDSLFTLSNYTYVGWITEINDRYVMLISKDGGAKSGLLKVIKRLTFTEKGTIFTSEDEFQFSLDSLRQWIAARNSSISGLLSDLQYISSAPKPSTDTFDYHSQNKHTQDHRRFTVSFYFGNTSSGPADDIEKAMISAGLNETTYSWGIFGPAGVPITHPSSHTGFGQYGLPWTISLQYSLTSYVAAGLVYSRSSIGGTTGYKSNVYLEIQYAITTISPLILINLENVIHLGLGPALYVTQTDGDGALSNNTSTMPGVLIDAGLKIQARWRFFVELFFQYRLTGDVEVGPFEKTFLKETVSLPAFKANYNHTLIGIGLGLRI